MKGSTLFFLFIATCLGVATYSVKQSVMSIEQDLVMAQKKIFHLEESLHILKAEWSHLNQPDRLQKLVENHLASSPIMGTQLASIEKVPSKRIPEHDQGGSVALASAE